MNFINHLFETYIIGLSSFITILIIKDYTYKYIEFKRFYINENLLTSFSFIMGLIAGIAIIYLLIKMIFREIQYEKKIILGEN